MLDSSLQSPWKAKFFLDAPLLLIVNQNYCGALLMHVSISDTHFMSSKKAMCCERTSMIHNMRCRNV